MKQLIELMDAITGWENSLWEVMKLGERRTNLAKVFNYREGLRREHDILPERFYEQLTKENIESAVLDKKEFNEAIDLMYEMMNWEEDGRPRKAKLHELDIGWAIDYIY
jgi:aldehyde:ferredoxin oxidoreductase